MFFRSPIGTPIVLQRMNYNSTTSEVAMEVANAMHAYWQEEQLLLARQHWTREYIIQYQL